MNARTLLSTLRDLGVSLAADGHRLHVDAPAGSITDQTKTTLVENKPHLLELLEWERRTLEVAGFKSKERCGQTIWQSPDNGFWYSQDMAMHLQSQEGTLL